MRKVWTDCTSCHCDPNLSLYTVLDLFSVLLKYSKDPLEVAQDLVSYSGKIAMFTALQINFTKNVIQAEIDNHQPITNSYNYDSGPPKNIKTPLSSSLQNNMSGLWSWIRLHHTAWSANESWSDGLSANHSCYLPPLPICKLQAVIVMSSTSKTLQYVMSTHLTHTETLYKRDFEVLQDKETFKQKTPWQINVKFVHYYATLLSNIKKERKQMHSSWYTRKQTTIF